MALDNLLDGRYALTQSEANILKANYHYPDECIETVLGILGRLESIENLDIFNIKAVTKMSYHAFKRDPDNFPHLEKVISFYERGIEIAKGWERCPALQSSPDILGITYSMSKMVSHMEVYLGELIFERYMRLPDREKYHRNMLFVARDLVSRAIENNHENDCLYMAGSYMFRGNVMIQLANISFGDKRRRFLEQEISDFENAKQYFMVSTENESLIRSCSTKIRNANEILKKTNSRINEEKKKPGRIGRKASFKSRKQRLTPPKIDFEEDFDEN